MISYFHDIELILFGKGFILSLRYRVMGALSAFNSLTAVDYGKSR